MLVAIELFKLSGVLDILLEILKPALAGPVSTGGFAPGHYTAPIG